jgi:hypothetical protein
LKDKDFFKSISGIDEIFTICFTINSSSSKILGGEKKKMNEKISKKRFLVAMCVGFFSFLGLIAIGVIFLPILSLGGEIILAIVMIGTLIATIFATVKFGKREAEERAEQRRKAKSDADRIFEQHVRPYLQPKQSRLADMIRANLETDLSRGITKTDLLVGNAIAAAECSFRQMVALFSDSLLTAEDIKESIHKAAVYVNEHFALRSIDEYERILHEIATNKDMWKD